LPPESGCVIVTLIENYSAWKPLKVFPEKSQILSCDAVVDSFKYLGAMVNIDSSIEEEIKERIAAGNRAYHVHKKLFTSKLISPKRQTTSM
jgi:hypothetical protein